MVWHAGSLLRGLIVRRPDQIVALAIGIGAESLIVNQGLKRIFRRTRPTADGDDRFDIRTPLTSSFPSGHASAAAFAATTLIGWDGRRSRSSGCRSPPPSPSAVRSSGSTTPPTSSVVSWSA